MELSCDNTSVIEDSVTRKRLTTNTQKPMVKEGRAVKRKFAQYLNLNIFAP